MDTTDTVKQMRIDRHNSLYPPLFLIIGLIIGWTMVVRLSDVSPLILPSPLQVAAALWTSKEQLATALVSTMSWSIVGIIIALVVAFFFAIIMDRWQLAKKTCYPLIVLSQTVQILAIAPLIILWVGFGWKSTLFITVLFCFFPITVSLVQGLWSTDEQYIQQLRAMNANYWQVLWHAKLPSALPSLFGGLKVVSGYAFISTTIGEWVGGSGGIGVFLLRSKNALNTSELFGGMVLCSLLSIGVYLLISAIEKRIIRWN